MMSTEHFSEIARRYKETSIIQSSAADILFTLLDIHKDESVLDAGCGTGNLTRVLKKPIPYLPPALLQVI